MPPTPRDRDRLPPALIDTRPEVEFCNGHEEGATSLPLDELDGRQHELPPRRRPIHVLDDDPDRAARAVAEFRLRGFSSQWEGRAYVSPTRGGVSPRLWEPSEVVARACDLIGAPRPGDRALDLACGSGRDAVHLASVGFAVDAVDLRIDALERTRGLARRSRVSVNAIERDLEKDGLPAPPEGGYQFVSMCYFLDRGVLAGIAGVLSRRGVVAIETFDASERARSGHPRREALVLRESELAAAFPGFQILAGGTAENRNGRIVQWIVARRDPG